MLPLVGKVLPPVEESRQKVLRSVVRLGLLLAERKVPVVLVLEPFRTMLGRPCLMSSVAVLED